MHKYTGNQKG